MSYQYFLQTNKALYDAPSCGIPKEPTPTIDRKQLEALHLATWRSMHAILRRKQEEDNSVEFVCWGIFDKDTGEKLYVSSVLTEVVEAK